MKDSDSEKQTMKTIAAGGFFGRKDVNCVFPWQTRIRTKKSSNSNTTVIRLPIRNGKFRTGRPQSFDGHKAMTVCMVIANRLIKEANTGYKNTIDHLILKVLERI